MKNVVGLMLWLVFAALAASPAAAGYDDSKLWFNALPLEDRSEIQSNLTLLGHYSYLIDGQFGNGTYDAIIAFQKTRSISPSGVLTKGDLQALVDKAGEVYRDFGMGLVTDEAGGAKLVVPQRLLSARSSIDNGTAWQNPDGSIVLETSHVPAAERSFKRLFLTLSTPSSARKVSYSSYNDSRFVVAGEEDGRHYYLMYRNAGTESVGYLVRWTPANDAAGTVISTYLASNFSPLSSAPMPEEQKKSAAITASLNAFGAFSLPADEDVIHLNGEIEDDTATEFMWALKARPNAKVLVLNSPGGYVNVALVIANEVHRRQMATIVESGDGCYSACAYIFFAGTPRIAEGELGVHQISAEVADLVLAQTTLGDVIDALDGYGVEQVVIVRMLRTPPEEMYVFTRTELREWGINRGDPTRVADLDPQLIVDAGPIVAPDAGPRTPLAFVHLAQRNERAEALRSLEYAVDRWAGVLAGAEPEIEQASVSPGGTIFRVRVPARSLESANAMCEAIRSAGGGCFVTAP